MSELLYQTDSYLREFDGEVTQALPEEKAVVLDRTAFYPGGGGQPNDMGTLDGRAVTKVRKSGDHMLHIMDGD